MYNNDYIFDFGKFSGKKLDDINLKVLDNYLEWMEVQENRSNKMDKAIGVISDYLNDPCILEDFERYE